MTSDSSPRRSFYRSGWRLLWFGLGVLLLVAVLRTVAWREGLQALRELSGPEIGALLGLNGVILLVLMSRWWFILLSLGWRLPLGVVFRYGLAGFAISYFTPGPQFGGEPVQILLLNRRHQVPLPVATASVVIDKVLTLLFNFTFLLLGLLYLFGRSGVGPIEGSWTLLLSGLLLAFPLLLIGGWRAGYRPLTRASGWLVRLVRGRGEKLRRLVADTEMVVTDFCHTRPLALAAALGLALSSWGLLFVEYWLMGRFVGLPLTGEQAFIMLTGVRLAWLMPVPGALGILETAQITGLFLIGLGAYRPLGVTMSLLIRLRDLSIGLVGLWAASAVGQRIGPGRSKNDRFL